MATSNLRDIKRIKSIDSTVQITNAMKLVSSAKLRKAKTIYEKSEQISSLYSRIH